jgi:chromate transporter
MFVGYAAGGIPGVFVALLGAALPPIVMMFVVAFILGQFQSEAWIGGFVKGLSPAVAALIIMVAWELFKVGQTNKFGKRTFIILVLSTIAFWLDVPSPLVLLGAGVLGMILFR